MCIFAKYFMCGCHLLGVNRYLAKMQKTKSACPAVKKREIIYKKRKSKSATFTFLQIQTLVISAKNTKNSIQIEPSATKDSIWRPTS